MRAALKIFLILSLFTGSLFAQETHIMIRAKAKNAKFIGSSIGGAKIIVRDAVTGEILDQGMTSGSTGNTTKIMKQPHERGKALSEENTAGFEAKLDIKEPLFVTVEAIAPFNKKQARVLSSTQLWVIPGKDITGDGVVLQIPGFVVDILAPQTHEGLSAESKVEIRANVVMMCGCPVTDGGLWDAQQYEVKALISREGEKVKEIPLKIGEKPSTFSAETDLEKGLYEVVVYAYDPVSGNTGVDKTDIIVK